MAVSASRPATTLSSHGSHVLPVRIEARSSNPACCCMVGCAWEPPRFSEKMPRALVGKTSDVAWHRFIVGVNAHLQQASRKLWLPFMTWIAVLCLCYPIAWACSMVGLCYPIAQARFLIGALLAFVGILCELKLWSMSSVLTQSLEQDCLKADVANLGLTFRPCTSVDARGARYVIEVTIHVPGQALQFPPHQQDIEAGSCADTGTVATQAESLNQSDTNSMSDAGTAATAGRGDLAGEAIACPHPCCPSEMVDGARMGENEAGGKLPYSDPRVLHDVDSCSDLLKMGPVDSV